MIGAILIALLKLLTSPLGWTMFLVGLLLPFGVIMAANAIGWAWPREFTLGLSQTSLYRSAIVVTKQGELLLKSVSLNDDGTAEIRVDNSKQTYSDPDGAMAWLKGVPFALADEASGTFFDPRHAWVGEQIRQAELESELEAPATEQEGENYGVRHWYRGVFELPQRVTSVDPSAMRNILTGGETANDGRWARTYYKNSRQHKRADSSLLRMMIPVIAFLAPVLTLFVIRNYLADSGGGGGGGTVVSFGTLIPIGAESLRQADWKTIGKWFAIVCGVVFGTLSLGLGLMIDPFTTILIAGPLTTALAIFVLTPFVASVSGLTGPSIGALYWRIALMGQQDLDVIWRRGQWETASGEIERPAAFEGRIFGTNVAIGFDPEEAFEESIDGRRVAASTEDIDQTGQIPSRIPVGYHRSKRYRREQHGQIGAFVPANIDIDADYLRVGPALNRLAGGMDGEATAAKWQQAKEDLGENAWMADDMTILKMSMLTMLAGAVMGSVLFYSDVFLSIIKAFV